MMVQSAFILILPLIHTVLSHRCFVCSPDNQKLEDMVQLKRNFPERQIPLCSEYKHSLKQNYLIECPKNSNGCLTKFEDDGSVMRTCAPIGIDDCKKANSVNYCYCSKDGCNTPDRRLSQPEGWAESKPRHGHELDLSAPRIQATDRLTDKKHSPVPVNQPPTDDEDAEEGSGGDDWGSFYYDSYYDTLYDKNLGGGLNYDTEPGFGDPDNADMTEPPPFIEQELEEELEKISRISNHKYDRELEKELENEIILVEETIPVVPRGSGADIRHIQSLLLLFPLLRYLLS
ncbi:uncharacterized protein LOC111702044 [Eurytemora carolleeae]|uniref:uncharacterized protein LOC111702044 n=1 Tax=Eurytemora carolleeae TaxID=1294199 RepID=UPI000C77AAC9|nr:uncharacterized protein LOC111702044 [Eurytemora carolleeae]|eukprot:XP_023329337.1 uncharacterized protein LOC111702044 [Eurytemora affinis]